MFTHNRTTITDRTLRGWLASRNASERETLARLWGLPLPGGFGADQADALIDAMLQPEALMRVLAALDERERAGLDRVLAEANASIPAAVLEREYGTVRKHDQYPNPRAYLLALQMPAEPTERLFTLALILPAQEGNRSVYYVPEDLRPLLPAVPTRDTELHLVPAEPPPETSEADADALERSIVTLLAAAQAGRLTVIPTGGLTKASIVQLAKRWGQSRSDLQGLTHEKHWPYVHFLRSIVESAGLMRINASQEMHITKAGQEWVQQPRVERLHTLLNGWVKTGWDELDSFLGIQIKGYAFRRDLPATRRAVLNFLRQAPVDQWVTWNVLLAEVQRTEPDFARPDGRYDNWRLANYRGESLDGYEHWREVEGEQLQSMIGGALRWLGLVDFGGIPADEEGHLDPLSFRLTSLGAAVLEIGPVPFEPVIEPLVVQGTFEVLVPPRATPAARLEIDRYAQWLGGEEVERYKLTKASVQAAVAAGASAETISSFLAEASGTALPPNVAYSLREWSGQYGQLTLERGALLRVGDPVLLEQIKRDRRVRMPRHESISHDTILLSEGDATALSEQLRKVGYGVAGDLENAASSPFKEKDLTLLAAALEFYKDACAELEIEGEASVALRQRVARLLNQRQRERAARIKAEAMVALRGRLRET